MRRFLAFVLILGSILGLVVYGPIEARQAAATPTPAPTATPAKLATPKPQVKQGQDGPTKAELEVWRITNQQRKAHGLAELAWSNELWCAARRHSEDMAAKGYFEHISLDGRTVRERAYECGYRGDVSENIGKNITLLGGLGLRPEAIVDGWMHSPGHKENLLYPDWKEIGIGYAAGGVWGYYTQDFGSGR